MRPYLQDTDFTLWVGDVRDVLAELEPGSVDCVITSPPYWGLRDYGTGEWDGGDTDCDHKPERGKFANGCIGCGCSMDQRTRGCGHCDDRHVKRGNRGTGEKDYQPYDPARGDLPNPPAGWAQRDATVTARDVCPRCGARRVDNQIGLEPTPDLFVQTMVDVFREVRRVLADHGTCWVNLSGSYASGDIRPSPSRAPSRGHAYGSGDREPADSPGAGFGHPDLCDGCRDAIRSHHGHTSRSDRSLAQDALALSTTACEDAPLDLALGLPDASPLVAPASTTQRSSPQPPGACSHCSNCDACLAVLSSSSRDARLCARMGAYTTGNGSTSSERRSQGRGASGTAWSNFTFKAKDLVPTPWMVAMALQQDGWYLRSDIAWAKLNPMPESVTDRPTSAWEHVFLLAKQPRYWFDAEAVREPFEARLQQRLTHNHDQPLAAARRAAGVEQGNPQGGVHASRFVVQAETLEGVEAPTPRRSVQRAHDPHRGHPAHHGNGADKERWPNPSGRNVRNVWSIATQAYSGAHFATFPEELVRRALLAGCPAEVCRRCGKPRERIVEATYENPGNRTTNGPRSIEQRHETPGFEQRLERRSETLGWSDCGHGGDFRPGVVLDPFIGSGTTALVARRHGRHSVGVELNPEYARLCAQRLQQLSLLAELPT